MPFLSFKTLFVSGVMLLTGILFVGMGCRSGDGHTNGKDKANTHDRQLEGTRTSETGMQKGSAGGHHMMHMADPAVQLDADLPVFQPSKRTYSNYLRIDSVENIYLRQNTALKNKARVVAFYQEALVKNGWTINLKRSSARKLVLKKDRRHATIRFFEMKQTNGKTLAISINVLRPVRPILPPRVNDRRKSPNEKTVVLCL